MVDIQSANAENIRGKKDERRRRRNIETTAAKYNGLPYRAAITSSQRDLTKGRIVAAHARLSRIRQVAPMCTPCNT